MCNLGRLCTVICENMPTPSWVKYPQPERFCFCCSVRTGASVIGWFTFILNALYTGLLMFSLAKISDFVDSMDETFMNMHTGESSGYEATTLTYILPDHGNIGQAPTFAGPVIYVQQTVIPTMYKTACIPGMMIVFSVLWLTAVESRTVAYLRIVGHLFIAAIVIQLILQLGFLIFVDVKSHQLFSLNSEDGKTTVGVEWIVWFIFVIYALMNVYFVPILYEFIKRRVREHTQGLDQNLLTSDMFPRARVAEAYIEDAFTLDMEHADARYRNKLESNDNDEIEAYSRNKGGYQQM